MFKRLWRLALLSGLSGSDGERDPLGAALGRLEREVMDVVWRGEGANVRGVQASLPRAVAYTTVMTTLDRLFKKGLLHRAREGRAFVYRAALTRQQVETAVAAGLLRGLLNTGAGGARPMLSNLVDVIGERDGALLDELEDLVRKKRRQTRQR
jgi:predicted transcriptional regulator